MATRMDLMSWGNEIAIEFLNKIMYYHQKWNALEIAMQSYEDNYEE